MSTQLTQRSLVGLRSLQRIADVCFVDTLAEKWLFWGQGVQKRRFLRREVCDAQKIVSERENLYFWRDL